MSRDPSKGGHLMALALATPMLALTGTAYAQPSPAQIEHTGAPQTQNTDSKPGSGGRAAARPDGLSVGALVAQRLLDVVAAELLQRGLR